MKPNQNDIDNEKVSEGTGKKTGKKSWEPMKLTHVGEAKDIVAGGGGKKIITQADPGDTNKQPGGDA